jgi:type VI secretion system protein ImpB
VSNVSKEGSIAPKERVNIVYKPATGNAQAEVELPLKMLLIGDYTGQKDDRPLEERKPINVDKENFNEVMASHGLALGLIVPNRLTAEPGAELALSLEFKTLADFTPEGIVNQVAELRTLLELRAALGALKSPLGNGVAFRKKVQSLLGDPEARKRLEAELALGDGSDKSGT